MKAKLLADQPALGVSVMIPSVQIVEMLGRLGFDWVLIDCEHGSIGIESVELMVMAAEAAGITPIVRPASNSARDILQVMDRGAAGVQVPHVCTADDARRAVASVRYDPDGRRGLAVGTRSADYGYLESMSEYVARANREALVCVQIEDAEALDNLDAILAVPGIDVFFVGPSDLSQSMGHAGNAGAAPVRAAIERTFDAILAAGGVAGTPCTSANIEALKARGVRYLYTHLTRLLEQSSRTILDKR
ncbi:MAG: 2-dehydro-3-deoxyglucarate aldolase [Ectothiorhodospiraceae bacterium]|nr:2-dehydro-3-deoxyglucarate aldolase [Ectothiorhodospiraceae bacterium]